MGGDRYHPVEMLTYPYGASLKSTRSSHKFLDRTDGFGNGGSRPHQSGYGSDARVSKHCRRQRLSPTIAGDDTRTSPSRGNSLDY